MPAPPFQQISSNRARHSPEDDELQRRAFTEAVAQAIIGWKADDSLVLSLEGPWGEGKTTAKNFIRAYLSNSANTSVVFDFIPWEWTDSDQIHAAFFDELAKHIQHHDKGKAAKVLAKRLKQAGTTLNASNLRTELGVLAATAAVVFGQQASQSDPSPVGWVIFVLAGLTMVGALFLFVSQYLESHHAGGETAEARKSELRKLMLQRNSTVVVLLDELDRLTGPELRAVFRLLKANADFPRLVFVLFLDRDVVRKELRSVTQGDPDAYLEKFIQLPFTLPVILPEPLWRQIDQAYLQLFPELGSGAATHLDRLQSLASPYFKDLRGVKRYLATLEFHAIALRGKHAEVHPLDLSLLTVLAVFEPSVYQALPSVPDIFELRLCWTGNF